MSVDRPVDRPLSRSTETNREQHLSIGRPGGRPLFCHGRSGGRLGLSCARLAHRSTGRSTGFFHRSTGQSIGLCPELLHTPFLLHLTSDFCAIFLYLLYLLSPYSLCGLNQVRLNLYLYLYDSLWTEHVRSKILQGKAVLGAS